MLMKCIGLFPGQGSQTVGMGKQLAEEFEFIRALFETADRVLGFPLSKMCFEGPAERLTETAIAQPAILTVSTACHQIFVQELPDAITLSAGAGHSLGEYSALVAAGAITFEDAVQLVHKRGRSMQEAVPIGQGKMAAIMGRQLPEIETVLESLDAGVVEVANINAPGQIVIAGAAEAIVACTKAMEGTRIVELQVSAPFHCSLMKPAEERLAPDLKALTIGQATFPVYANYSAQPVSSPEDIRTALIEQVCGRVRWVESINRMIADTSCDTALEFGEGSVLSGLLKRIDKSINRVPINSSASLSSLLSKD